MKNRIAAIVVVRPGCRRSFCTRVVVEEGKQVIVTQFGKPVATFKKAGLHFKSPFIQEVHYLEKRLLPWDGAPESMQRTTRNGSTSTSGHAGGSI